MFRKDVRIIQENDQPNAYLVYQNMEDLLEKLKLLNYEVEFIKHLKMTPIHRYYFVIQKNPGEQFYLFTSLAAWLVRITGKFFDQPQEYDDPNSTIANILNHAREIGVSVDFPPNKLKQGVGEQVVYVLNHLADAALKHTNFKWKKPSPEIENDSEAENIDDESELILDQIEEEIIPTYSDDSDEDIFNFNDLLINKNKRNKTEENTKIKDVVTNVDQEAWQLELELVLPRLKVTIKNDNRDWRNHLEQMMIHKKNIQDVLSGTKSQLEKLQQDISSSLEKITNREKHLNRDLEPVLEKYRTLQHELSKLQDNYNVISGGVAERTREFAKLSDQLETIKQQMEARGSSMTDGTPLVNIRKGIGRIKAEITEIDVRLGVLNGMLVQSRLRDNQLLEEDLV